MKILLLLYLTMTLAFIIIYGVLFSALYYEHSYISWRFL